MSHKPLSCIGSLRDKPQWTFIASVPCFDKGKYVTQSWVASQFTAQADRCTRDLPSLKQKRIEFAELGKVAAGSAHVCVP
jgi:hypothetical protein